jgi:hypothetical protein
MLPLLSPQPEAKCYTFDAVGGRLYVPFGQTIWQPSNPDYDPGPLPPPREPRPQKIPNSEEHPPTESSDQTQIQVDCGSGSGSALPALQPNPSSQGPRFFRGHSQSNSNKRGPHSLRGHSQRGHSQPNTYLRGSHPNRRGNRGGYRGMAYGPPNHMQHPNPHFASQNNPRNPPHESNNGTRPFRSTGFSPPTFSQPILQTSDADMLSPSLTSTSFRQTSKARTPKEAK